MKRQKKRILSILLTLCMVCSTISMPVYAAEIEVVPTSTDTTQVITEFAALADDVKEQQLEIGAEESAITLPDTLQVKVGEADVELTGIIWEIDAENSVSDTFDSSEEMNGAFYYFAPILPDKDADGNTFALADGVNLPEIIVVVGTSDIATQAATSTQGDDSVASVKIGEVTTYYNVFTEAVTAATTATTSTTITLLQDVKTEAPIEIPTGKEITLDLHGCTIDRGLSTPASLDGYVIFNQGVLTIQDNGEDTTKIGTITGGNNEDFAGGINNYGSLTITGGSITGNHIENSGGGGITNYGTLTITGGSITGNTIGDGSKKYYGTGIFNYDYGSSLTIEGGTLEDDLYIVDGTVALTGGSFSEISANNVGRLLAPDYVYKDSTTDAYITDAATLDGETISNVTVAAAPIKITTQPSDGAVNVALEVVAEHTTADDTTPITYQWHKDGDTTSTVLGEDSTYTPTEVGSYYCTVTCGGYPINTNTATVGVASVKIGEGDPTNYETLAAAFAAVNGKTGTITVLADTTLPASEVANDSTACTLELGGHTVTVGQSGNTGNLIEITRGSVTIQDTSEGKTGALVPADGATGPLLYIMDAGLTINSGKFGRENGTNTIVHFGGSGWISLNGGTFFGGGSANTLVMDGGSVWQNFLGSYCLYRGATADIDNGEVVNANQNVITGIVTVGRTAVASVSDGTTTKNYPTLKDALDAANDDVTDTPLTVKVLYIFADSYGAALTRTSGPITLDLGRALVSGTLTVDGATLTLQKGTLDGSVTVENGKLTLANTAGIRGTSGAALTINGGEVEVRPDEGDAYAAINIYDSEDATAIKQTGGTLTVNGGSFGGNTAAYSQTDGTATLNGGYFSKITVSTTGKTVADLIAADHVYKDNSGNCVADTTVTELTEVTVAVATVASVTHTAGGTTTTTEYETFYAAIGVAVDGDTITLLKNTEANGMSNPTSKGSRTLDLHGNTLTLTGNSNISITGGSLTVMDSTGTDTNPGKIISGKDTYATVGVQGGTFTLESGTIENTYSEGRAVNAYSNVDDITITITITGGHLVANGSYGWGLYVGEKVTAKVTGGTVEGDSYALLVGPSTTKVELTGGTFKAGTTASINVGEEGKTAASLLPTGYAYYKGETASGELVDGSTAKELKETVTVGTAPVATMTVGDITTNYTTLTAALQAANADETDGTVTVKALEGSTGEVMNVTLTRTAPIVLDLGGKTVTGQEEGVLFTVNGANVTVQNGTLTRYCRQAVVVVTSGTLNLGAGLTLYNWISAGAIDVYVSGGTVNVNGATIGNGDGYASVEIHNGELNVTAGTLTRALNIYGGTVTLTGGSFSGIEASATGKTVAELLGDGSGYKNGGTWVTDTALAAKIIANVTVEQAPVKITSQPTAEPTLVFGNTVVLKVETDKTEGVSYQWMDNGTVITGANEASYTTDKNMTDGAHSFICKVSIGDYTALTHTVSISYNYDEPDVESGVYQIANASNLMWFAAHVNNTSDTTNRSANAVLTADIDMQGIVWPGMASYAGTFDGSGFTISNLCQDAGMADGARLGLIVDLTGTVKNLTIKNPNLWGSAYPETTNGTGCGAVAGNSIGTVENVIVSGGSIHYGNYVGLGGIVGKNNADGVIKNCAVISVAFMRRYNSVNNKPIGGITDSNSGTVQNCYTYGVTFTNASAAGGIVASGNAPTNSYFYTTAATSSAVDGIVKNADEFASGEVAYLLNGSKSTPAEEETLAWYQNLSEGGDAYPVLKSTGSNTVYKNGDSYANTQKYTITTTSSVKGSDAKVTVSPIKVQQEVEGKATVIAQEMDGYKFLGWFLATEGTPGYDTSKNAEDTNLSYTFDLKSDISLVAVYEANGSVNVAISGSGFKVKYGTTTSAEQTSSYNKDLQLGTTVTLTASNEESFLYWKNENNKIMSQSASYTFTVTGKTNLTLVSKATAENTAFVEFVSAYNQVISGAVYNATSTELALPTEIPSKVGYNFVKWGMTVGEIKTAITEGKKHITVSPEYEIKAETYSITQYNAQGGVILSETPVTYTDLAPGSTKTLTAETIEGKKFKCWSSDVNGATVLGTNESYFMQLSSDVTIYAIYVADTETVEKVPTIVMTNKYATTVSGTNKVSFVATRTVPEGYTLVEHGMLYNKNGSIIDPTEDSFIVGGINVMKYSSSDMASNGVFTLNIKVPAIDTVVYARAYMVVKNNSTGNEETIYSTISNGKFSDFNN